MIITPDHSIIKPPAMMMGMDGGMSPMDGMGRRHFYGGGGPPPGGGGLQDDIPSACFHLDATDSASYPGSGQTWANLIASPADGASATDYDCWLGETASSATDDPTFNGTAGDAAAYFSVDGGDFWRMKPATTPGFINDVHKTGQDDGFWFAFAFRRISGGNTRFLYNGTATSDRGCGFLATDTVFQISRYRAPSTVQSTNVSHTFSNNTDYLAIVSWNAARDSCRTWVNGRTATNTTPTAWSALTTDATNPIGLGVNYPTKNSFSPSGTRFYAFAGGNAFLDNTAAGMIFDFFNDQHGRTYA